MGYKALEGRPREEHSRPIASVTEAFCLLFQTPAAESEDGDELDGGGMQQPPPRPSSVAEGDMGVLQARVRELQTQARPPCLVSRHLALAAAAWIVQPRLHLWQDAVERPAPQTASAAPSTPVTRSQPPTLLPLPCLPAPIYPALPALPALQNDLMQRELDHMSDLAARQEQQLK
jgi:hypothetical protein